LFFKRQGFLPPIFAAFFSFLLKKNTPTPLRKIATKALKKKLPQRLEGSKKHELSYEL